MKFPSHKMNNAFWLQNLLLSNVCFAHKLIINNLIISNLTHHFPPSHTMNAFWWFLFVYHHFCFSTYVLGGNLVSETQYKLITNNPTIISHQPDAMSPITFFNLTRYFSFTQNERLSATKTLYKLYPWTHNLINHQYAEIYGFYGHSS